MSESDFKRIRIHLRLLTVCVIVLIALLIANLVHRNFNPKSTSFPRIVVVNGKNGKDATVDYSAIDQYAAAQVQAQIAAIPKPQNGINGQPGVNGQNGTQGITGVQGQTGTSGQSGTNGQNGIDGLTLQIQVDPITCQLQDKYTVSDAWITLAQLPVPCGVLP